MILDTKIKLLSLDTNLRFDRLIQYVERECIPIIDCRLHNCYGMAIDKGVYIDFDKILSREGPEMLFFTILHECAHYKHIRKVGKQSIINQLTETDFDKFSDSVIKEEITADKYASRLFFLMNGVRIPTYKTQQLNLSSAQEYYKMKVIPHLFNKVKNEEEYDNLWIKFIANA